MSDYPANFSDEFDFLAVCYAAINRQDYKAALYSLRQGRRRNLEAGPQADGGELMRCLHVVVTALESNLRKAYGYDWDQNINIPEAKENWRESRCAFCRKKKEEVVKVIVGQAGSICNECVGICNEILRDEASAGSSGGAAR